VFTSNRATE